MVCDGGTLVSHPASTDEAVFADENIDAEFVYLLITVKKKFDLFQAPNSFLSIISSNNFLDQPNDV